MSTISGIGSTGTSLLQYLDQLQQMVQNSNGEDVDISKLFSGVPVGSELDVMA